MMVDRSGIHRVARVQRGGLVTVAIASFATVTVCLAGCGGPAPASTAPSATPTPTQSAEPSDTPPPQKKNFVRIAPGTQPDIRISQGYRRAAWTGAWGLDIAGLTLINRRNWMVVKLNFSQMALQRMAGYEFDLLSIRLAVEDDPASVRTMDVQWGGPGGSVGWSPYDRAPRRCYFQPQADVVNQTVTMRVPRECFPPEPLRATARFASERYLGPGIWVASDTTAWTDFASIGETVTVADPAQ